MLKAGKKERELFPFILQHLSFTAEGMSSERKKKNMLPKSWEYLAFNIDQNDNINLISLPIKVLARKSLACLSLFCKFCPFAACGIVFHPCKARATPCSKELTFFIFSFKRTMNLIVMSRLIDKVEKLDKSVTPTNFKCKQCVLQSYNRVCHDKILSALMHGLITASVHVLQCLLG